MEYINIITGLGALIIAMWAFNLQRREIIKNTKMNALIHASQLIQERIDYRGKLIDAPNTRTDMRYKHIAVINKELRPLKSSIDFEFIKHVGKYDSILYQDKLQKILKSENKLEN